jgi:hypothetical protein
MLILCCCHSVIPEELTLTLTLTLALALALTLTLTLTLALTLNPNPNPNPKVHMSAVFRDCYLAASTNGQAGPEQTQL